MNQLDYLKKFSVIAIDSEDINAIHHYRLKHAALTNSSIILKSTLLSKYQTLLENALTYSLQNKGSQTTQIENARDKLTVNIGTKILENISGTVSTEIDARLSFDTKKIIKKAYKLIKIYQKENNIKKSRILIKIAATWEGIKAAEELEKNGIRCHLTLLFSLAQARACAESNIYLISPFVGQIWDWHYKRNLLYTKNIDSDPGIQTVKKIFYYYKNNDYKTIIMGANFRTTEQILALSGCDYLTISPEFLKKLSNNVTPITQNLSFFIKKILEKTQPLSQSKFFLEYNKNQMAIDQLTNGIKKLSDEQKLLDHILKQKLYN